MDTSPFSSFLPESSSPPCLTAKRGSAVSLLSPPPLSLLPLVPPHKDELFGPVFVSDDEGATEDESAASDSDQMLSDCETESAFNSRRSSDLSTHLRGSIFGSRRVSLVDPTIQSGTASTSSAQAGQTAPVAGQSAEANVVPEVKRKRRHSILSFASLCFSPKTLIGRRDSIGRHRLFHKQADTGVSPATNKPQTVLEHATDQSALLCKTSPDPRTPDANNDNTATTVSPAGTSGTPEIQTRVSRPRTSAGGTRRPCASSLHTRRSTISLFGTSVTDLAQPPLPLDIEPILKLPPQPTTPTLLLPPGSPVSTLSTATSGGGGAAFNAAVGGMANAAGAATTAIFKTTFEASAKLGSALMPPGSKRMVNQTATAASAAFTSVKDASRTTARRMGITSNSASMQNAGTSNQPQLTEYFMPIPASSSNSIGKQSEAVPTSQEVNVSSTGFPIMRGAENNAAPRSIPPSPGSDPSTGPPSQEQTMQVLQQVGWTWGAAAARAFDHPPNRQKRLSIADIDDDMIDGLQRIPSQELDPFVFNADDPEIAHWSRFTEAYAAGEIDLNNGLPRKPPRGVPDPSLCPFATPLACGPFRAPKPLWEQDRQRAMRRVEIALLDAPALQEIQRCVTAAQTALHAPSARCAIIDGDCLVTLTAAGILQEPFARDSSLCAHTILNRNRGMVVLDTKKDWRFPDAEELLQTRFYAGAPVTTANGMPIGCLAVWDSQPWQDIKDDQRNILRVHAKAIGKELEAFLVRRFESKIARMNDSFKSLALLGEELRQAKEEKVKQDTALVTLALDRSHRVIANRGKGVRKAGHTGSCALRRVGSQPTLSANSERIPPEQDINLCESPPAEIMCLGLLVDQEDAVLLNHLVRIIRTTLDMSVVYLAGIALSNPGQAPSPLGQRCIIAASDGCAASTSDLHLDYAIHAKAAQETSAEEGVIIQDLDRKAIKQGKGPAKVSTGSVQQVFQAGLLVPIQFDHVKSTFLATTNASSESSKDEPAKVGFVLGAFSADASKALGIEDLRYLQKFAMIFSVLLVRYTQALDLAVEEARRSTLRAAAAPSVAPKEKGLLTGMIASSAQAVKNSPRAAYKGTVAVSKGTVAGTVAVTRGSASAIKSVTASTKKALRPSHSRVAPRPPGSHTTTTMADEHSLFNLDTFAKGFQPPPSGSGSMGRAASSFSNARAPLSQAPNTTLHPLRPILTRAAPSDAFNVTADHGMSNSKSILHFESPTCSSSQKKSKEAKPELGIAAFIASATANGHPRRPLNVRTQSYAVQRSI
ncbi:hypothetical protein K437DRAFT_254509, partial [Tilletiaria anomala UBC 951]